jgi:nucleoside phosphorylase
MSSDPTRAPTYAILAALPEELAVLRERSARTSRAQGLELWELEFGPVRAQACVGGVGKVNAAHATSALFAAGATRGLFVVGVCGGLRQSLPPGTLVHCERAVQTDLALRSEREVESDADLRRAWISQAGGACGWFLTADRPVLSLWRRLRLARAFAGPCVADMETAAAASVARRAGVPWAAARVVTDGATEGGIFAFRKNFALHADRAAATLPALLEALEICRNGSAEPGLRPLAPRAGPQ